MVLAIDPRLDSVPHRWRIQALPGLQVPILRTYLQRHSLHWPHLPYLRSLRDSGDIRLGWDLGPLLHFLKLFSPSLLSLLFRKHGKNKGWTSVSAQVQRSNPVSADASPSEAAASSVGGPTTVPAAVHPFSPTRVAATVQTAPTAAVAASTAPTVAASPALTAVQGSAAVDAVGSSSVAPTQRSYLTQVGPTLSDPSHRRPARRAPPPKRAQTSSLRESSTSRPRAPPSPPYLGITGAPDLSPASIIRRPYFHCSPIPGNADCNERDLHEEVYYDLPGFTEDPEL